MPELTLGTLVAQLGISEVSFPAPVFTGDTVRVETKVVEARASSRPEAGIVVFEHRASNQRHELVCKARRTALMRRGPSPAAHRRDRWLAPDMILAPRSLFFVPGSRPDMIAKVPRWQPDVAVVDLEDAVAASENQSARGAAVTAIADLDAGSTVVLVRVNSSRSPWYADDVGAVADWLAGATEVPVGG